MTFILLVLLAFMSITPPTDFFERQLKFPRVAKAYAQKRVIIESLLSSNNIQKDNFDLFIRAFKHEQKLEAWVKNKNKDTYKLLKTYPFTAVSGLSGPKRRSGDLQIPEGVYSVTTFNPQSNYHLSFKINYPNKSDLFFADPENPGGDIYIHGSNVTVGCIPLGDSNIEELYLIAAKARGAGGVIPVHIFPVQLNDTNFKQLLIEHKDNKALTDFWTNLKPVYEVFDKANSLPEINIDGKGRYQIRK